MGDKVASYFRPERIGTLVSIATNIKNLVATLAPLFLILSSSFFQETTTTKKSGQSSNLGQIGPKAAELAALEQIEKFS